MSRWRPEVSGLGLSAGSAVLVSGGKHPVMVKDLSLHDHYASASSFDWPAALSIALAPALPGNPGFLHVTPADDWARYCLITPPAGMNSLEELRAYAEARFEALFSESARDWYVEADWRAGGSMIACALPRVMVASLRAVSQQFAWRLASVQPWALRLLNKHAASIGPDAWVCIVGAESVLTILLRAGSPQIVRQIRFDGQVKLDALIERLNIEQLRAGLDAPAQLYLGGDILPQTVAQGLSTMRVHFLPREQSLPSLGRVPALPEASGLASISAAWRMAVCGVLA